VNRPLASVIVPVRDGERFLSEALESVLSQDYRPLELIVVDDGSSDRSPTVAESFPAVRLLRQPHRGASAARNLGVRAATGEVVAFLDHDDRMPSHKLTVQVGHLVANPSVGCVLGRMRIFMEDGTSRPRWLGTDRVYGDLGGIPVGSMVMWAGVVREVGEFDERLSTSEDLDWLVRARSRGVRISILPDVVLHRRIHHGNLTHRNTDGLRSILPSLKRHLDGVRAGGHGST